MGREIRRVPLDFDWPLEKVWEGFLMPDRLDGEPCPDCRQGQTYAGWWLQHLCQRLAMLANDVFAQQRGRPMHPWLANDPYPPTDSTHLFMPATRVLRPSEDILTLVAGLSGKSVAQIRNSSAGSSWEYQIRAGILRGAGLEDWGGCTTCDGEGTLERYPGQRAEAEAWEGTNPPTGEGWQMWETVSEGSPVSPVFATAEDLAQWLTTSAGGQVSGPSRRPMTIEQAHGFVGAGWAPSMIVTAGGIHGGAEYVGTEQALGGHLDGRTEVP